MRKFLLPGLLILLMASCTKDRDVEKLPPPETQRVVPGSLLINELVAKGSVNVNEFGNESDWFEIYNPGSEPVTIEPEKWYVTDNLTSPLKYALPGLTIPSGGFLVLWCDTLNMVATQIHTNFGLSASGEDLGLFFLNENDSLIQVDAFSYPALLYSGQSYGRSPDGSNQWIYFPVPTPGSPNQ